MRSKPPLQLNTRLFLVTAASAALAALLTSCASESRLVASAPQGVDLSGQWRLNENLSDDPGRLEEPKELPPKTPSPSRNPAGRGKPGTTMPGMPGGPGTLDPGGGGENLTSTGTGAGGLAHGSSGLVPVIYTQDTTLPSGASDGGPAPPAAKPPARDGTVARMLSAPALLTISQSGGKLVVKSVSDGSSDEYTAGEQRTIPFGQTEADRSAGWRDAAFVVITKAHKGPSKEDDFALDSEGHLIFATLVTHVKKGPIDFKRVYDRVRTP